MFAIIWVIIFLISSVSLPFFQFPIRVPSIPASWFQTITYFSFLVLVCPTSSLPLLYLFTFAAVMFSSLKQNSFFLFHVSWDELIQAPNWSLGPGLLFFPWPINVAGAHSYGNVRSVGKFSWTNSFQDSKYSIATNISRQNGVIDLTQSQSSEGHSISRRRNSSYMAKDIECEGVKNYGW